MRRVRSAGFSAVELMAAVAITAIVGLSAVPASRLMRSSIERGEALNQIEFDLRRIRTEAVATGLLAVFQVADTGKSYSTGFDLLPYNSPPRIEENAFSGGLPNSIGISASAPIYFDSRGFLVNDVSDPTTSTLTVTSDGATFAQIIISPTGALDVHLQ